MTVYVDFLNLSGFPSGIPGDAYAGIGEDGGVLPSYLMPSAYQGSTVSVDIKFTVKYPDSSDPLGELMVSVPVKSVTALTNVTPIGMSFVKLTDTDPLSETHRFSGTYTNVFLDEYYKFKMRDLQEKVLPAINNEDYLALFDYNPPPTKHILKSYQFLVEWDSSLDGLGIPIPSGEETITITQNLYWNYSTSIATFQQVLSTGEL